MTYLGIDCGTQSLKALAWSPDTGKVQSISRSYDLIPGLPAGHKEQDPRDWIVALEACIGGLREEGVDLGSVRGIGVAGQQHGLVTLDDADEVVRPAKLWCDTSTSSQCEAILEAAGGPKSYQEEIGNLLPPGFTASKILWLKQKDPDAYGRIRAILLPHDYLNFYLTGEKVTEAGDASGTGYFRVRSREWSAKALHWIDSERDLARLLPGLIESREAAGTLRKKLAQSWGMTPGIAVSSGGGDNMMGAIGSGNVSPGTVTVSLGTSGTLFSYSESPVVDPEGEIAAFCDSTGGWLPLGCTMSVTVATEMMRTAFGLGDHVQFEQAVESVPAGCRGLILLPYLEGERLPNVPDGTGVLLGVRPPTSSPAYLARAAIEGVTFGLKYGLDRLQDLGIRPSEIRLIGGGSKSRAWRQIVADILQLPVVCPSLQEGPAIGAAIQALWCREGGEIGDCVDQHFRLDESTRCSPGLENRGVYQELYAVYSSLSRTLAGSDVFSAHRRMISG